MIIIIHNHFMHVSSLAAGV